MEPRKARKKLIILSVIILASGNLALWLLFPPILDMLGGINLLSFSLIVASATFFVLLYAYILKYAQGKPPQRWRLQVALTYMILAVVIILALVYDMALPSNVPFPWRLFILPMATVVITFYALRRIPRVRKKIDEFSKDW